MNRVEQLESIRQELLNARILWAFSAAYRILGHQDYLQMAQRAKDYIEEHFLDKEYCGCYWTVDRDGRPLDTKKHVYAMAAMLYAGYAEATSRTWTPLDDARLSEQDEATDRSLNAHLHLLEAYTGLYRVWPDAVLASRLKQLMGLMLEKMVNPATGHLGMFFSEGWQRDNEVRCYGHDVEAAWLILDAARILKDPCHNTRMCLLILENSAD